MLPTTTTNTTNTPLTTLSIGVGGLLVEARAYRYLGAPAFEVYITSPHNNWGPVAYYEAEATGLNAELLNVGAIEEAATRAFPPRTDGAMEFDFMQFRAQLYNVIEQDLLDKCEPHADPFTPVLSRLATFETDRWFIAGDVDNTVYVRYLNTGVQNYDAYRLVFPPAIVEVARTWVAHDPLWGVQTEPVNKPRVAQILAAEFEEVAARAINAWKATGALND